MEPSSFLLISVLPLVVSSVSIRDISAPAAVEAGKELLLDCDFTYNKEELEEVVVKWFHNNSTTPFYQWVPALDIGPQIISKEFSGQIDLAHTVEGGEEFTRHRQLRIANIKRQQAGLYTCQVSSFTLETTMGRHVSVYVPPHSMEIETVETEEGDVAISCVARGIFPTPELTLSWTERLTPKQSSLSAVVQKDEDSLFSTSLSETVAVASVGREDVAVCSLNLPGTGYTREEQATLLKEQIPVKFLKMFEADAADMNVKIIPGVAAEYEDKEHDHALTRNPLPFEPVVSYSGAASLSTSVTVVMILVLSQVFAQ